MNPFLANSMPIDMLSDLFSREQEIRKIKEYVDCRVQTVILGVEGVGKTSLLKTVFSQDYRIDKAKENILISSVTEYPSNLKDDDIYNHFIETIIGSIRILSLCGEEEKMQDILNKCRINRSEKKTIEDEFEVVVNTIHDCGFHVVIVVDNFERFTSSNEVTMKHHETLRRMLQKTQYVVATNYDLNEDSLPHDVSGSLLLMNFAGHEIRIGGWTKEQTFAYIRRKLENQEINFSEEITNIIFTVSGGIPLLVKSAAQYAYDHIEMNRTERGIDFADLYAERKTQLLLQHWCKMLTPIQIKVLRDLRKEANAPSDTKAHDAAKRSLYLRGILNYKKMQDSNGHIIVSDNKYQHCSYFLVLFCEEGEKLEIAASKNPLKQEPISQENTFSLLTVEQLMAELKKRIEEGVATKEQLLSITRSLCQFMPDVTGTIDLNEDLPDEVLDKYLLSKDYLEKFDPKVREFIYVGIQMDRCFENVTRSDFDFSSIYLSFCKAAELHLNLTIVPVMKNASPNAVDQYGTKISRLSANRSLMMGAIYTILTKHQIGLEKRVIDVIKQHCRAKQLTEYSNIWWNDFEELFLKVKSLRNDCPHTSMLKDESGTRLLQLLFGDEKNSEISFDSQNSDKSFMMRCLNLHRDFMSTYSVNG